MYGAGVERALAVSRDLAFECAPVGGAGDALRESTPASFDIVRIFFYNN